MPQDPDVVMEGYLYKRASKAFKSFKRRWFFIKNNQLCYRKRDIDTSDGASDSNVFHILPEDEWAMCFSIMVPDLRLCLVRPAPNNVERQYCFELVTPNKIHLLQADSESLCNAWIKALQRTIESALHDGSESENNGTPRTGGVSTSCVLAAYESDVAAAASASGSADPTMVSTVDGKAIVVKAVNQILALPGNEVCADCGASQPQWASVNLGVTLCIACCGVHRSLSVQVSKVRSLVLDAWEPDQVRMMMMLGNAMVNGVYLAHWTPDSVPIPAKPDSNPAIRDSWIRAKYLDKSFSNEQKAVALSHALRPLPHFDESHYAERGTLDPGGIAAGRISELRSGRTQSVAAEDRDRGGRGDAPLSLGRLARSTPSQLNLIGTGSIGDKQPVSATSKLRERTAKDLKMTSAGSESQLVDQISKMASLQQISTPFDIAATNRTLYDAVSGRDFKAMITALARGASMNAPCADAANRTPIFEAVFQGSLEVTEFLLLNGAKVNVQDTDGLSPLHLACASRNTGQVCKLLRRGANQELTSVDGETPLDIAMKAENADIVTLLRLAKLNQEIKSDEEWSGIDDTTFTDVVNDFTKMASTTTTSPSVQAKVRRNRTSNSDNTNNTTDTNNNNGNVLKDGHTVVAGSSRSVDRTFQQLS